MFEEGDRLMSRQVKKVFISYSHDSPEHERQVLALSERLRADGIDCWIDQYDPYPEEGWPRWMEQQINEAEAVLLICTPTYRKRVEGKEEPGIGKGVCWEANLIYNHLYSNKQQTSQFVPILFSGAGEDDIPKVLQGQAFYRVHDEEGYESLYRRLTNQLLVTPGSLGSVRRLPKVEVVSDLATESAPVAGPSQDQARKFFISYPQGDPSDENLARFLHSGLTGLGHEVFVDIGIRAGTDWVRAIRDRIHWCDTLVVLLSERSMGSEMVHTEVRLAALQLGQTGRPKIIPVRLGYLGPLEYELEIYLGGLQHITWKSEADSRQVLTAIRNSVGSQEHTEPAPLPSRDEPAIEPGPDSSRPRAGRDPRAAILQDGPIRNDDPCYIERKQDRVVLDLAEIPEQTLVIKGPHQTGKSSLLLQYLSKAQSAGKRIAFVDFKIFSINDLEQYDRFLTSFARVLVRRLRLAVEVPEIGGQIQLLNFMEDQILPALEAPTVLAFDEVGRVLGRPYQQDFFSMLRLWHEHVSSPLYPDWTDLDLALVISTEPHLLIDTAYRSPFTVGHRIETAPFDEQQCRELDRRYPDVLTAEQQTQLWQLLRGHPYLTRLAYYRLTAPDRIRFDQLIEQAALDNGPFGDHLRALRVRLGEHPELLEAFGQARRTGRVDNRDLYHQLYGAGLVREEEGRINPANLLYARYFRDDR